MDGIGTLTKGGLVIKRTEGGLLVKTTEVGEDIWDLDKSRYILTSDNRTATEMQVV